jgi:hypothetical protein
LKNTISSKLREVRQLAAEGKPIINMGMEVQIYAVASGN